MKTYTSIEGIIPELTIMYHVKIGEKGKTTRSRQSQKEFQLPKKLDHFKITSIERGEDNNFIEEVEFTKKLKEKYGDKPRELDIRFLYDQVSLNFPHRFACYVTASDLKKKGIESNTKRCYCTGNGQKAIRLTKAGSEEIDCIPDTCNIRINEEKGFVCKAFGRLLFTVPGLTKLGECADFATTSFKSIKRILGSFGIIKHYTHRLNPEREESPLAGIPLKLIMYKATDETEKQGMQTNWKVMVRFDGDENDLAKELKQLTYSHAASVAEIKQIENMVINTVCDIEEEEAEDIQAEYWPSIPDADFSHVPVEVLREIAELGEKLEYNDAKINMLYGEYRDREAEIIPLLKAELQKKFDVQPPEKEAETKGLSEKKTYKLDKDKKNLFDGTESLPTDGREKVPPGDEKTKDERNLLFDKIKGFKASMPASDFNAIRNKFNLTATELSIQELRDLAYELEGIALGAK